MKYWKFGQTQCHIKDNKPDGPKETVVPNAFLRFSNRGKWLVYASDKGIHMLDSATEREFRLLQSRGVNSIAVGDTYVAAGELNGAVHVWDPASGELLTRLESNLEYVAAVAFSPNKRTLLTACGFRGVVKIWDTKTWSLQHTLKAQPPFHSVLRSIAFSQNGKRIAFLYSDSLSIWDAEQYYYLPNIKIKFPRNDSRRNQILFFAEDSYIDTTFGRVYLNRSPDGNFLWKVKDARGRVYDDWLYHDGQRLLWLFPDF